MSVPASVPDTKVGPPAPPSLTVARPAESNCASTSTRALICSRIESRWSASPAAAAVPGLVLASEPLICASEAPRSSSVAVACSAVASRSCAAPASALPEALNEAATADALSSITARCAVEVGSAASPCALVKKSVIRADSPLPVSADWMPWSHTAPVCVRARSLPAERTASLRRRSAEREMPATIAPMPVAEVAPGATTSPITAVRLTKAALPALAMFSDTVVSAVWYARTPEAPMERRSLIAQE